MRWYLGLPAIIRWPLWFLLRFFVFTVEAIFGLLLFVLLVVFFVLGSQWGRETLLTEGLRRGLALTPFELEMSRVESLHPSLFELAHFRLSYQTNPLIELHNLSLSIPWDALREQHVKVEHVQIERLDIDADPAHWPGAGEPSEPEPDAPTGERTTLPDFLADWKAGIGNIQLTHFQVRHPILPAPLEGRFKLDNFVVSALTAPVPQIELEQFRLGLDEGRHWIRGQLHQEQITAEVHLERFPLDVLDAFLDDFNTGWLTASVKVRGPVMSPRASGRAETSTQLLGMPLQASTDIAYRDLAIRFKQLKGRWDSLQATASGKVDLDKGALDIQVQDAQTPLSFANNFGASLPPDLTAEVTAQNVSVTGPYAEVRYRGQAQANGRFRALPFTLSTAVDGGVNSIRLTDVALQTAEGRVTASGAIDFAGRFSAEAELNEVSVDLLERLEVPLPADLKADLQARLSGQLKASGRFTQPQFQTQFHIAGRYREQSLDIDAKAEGNLRQIKVPALAIKLDGSQEPPLLVTAGLIDLAAQRLDLQAELKRIPLELVALADLQLPKGLDGILNGKLAVQGPWVRPTLDTQLDLQGKAKTLPYAVTVDAALHERLLDVRKIQVTLDDRRILGIEGQLSEQQQTLAVMLSALDLKQLKVFGVKDAKGRLSANVRYQGHEGEVGLAGRVNYAVDVDWDDADGNTMTVPIELNSRISTENQVTAIATQVLQQGEETSAINVQVPVKPYREWILAALDGGAETPFPAQFTVDGTLDLKSIEAFMPNDLETFAGMLKADLRSEGALPDPKIYGSVRLAQGRYRNELSGTDLHEIDLEARLEGDWLSVQKGNIRTPEGGEIDLSGQLAWGGDQAVNLTALAREAVVLERPDVEAAISGKVALTGDKNGYLLGGELNLKPLTINVNSAYSGVPEIKVKVIEKTKAGQTLGGQAAGKGGSIPLRLDIAVVADQQAYLRGRGLATELKGVVKVVGPIKKPRFTGNFETIRGSIELFGKRFTLVRGTAEFDGTNVILDIEAEHEGKEETFKVRVTGTLDDFNLELTSDPVLPQDEVLSRLLFGKSVKNITPMQAVRLITAIQTLQGGNSLLPDPISYARDLVGVDDLNVESTETKDGEKGVTVGVGKYLSEGVYFELKRTPDPNRPWQGTLDIELTPSLHLQTTTSGAAGEEGVELIWKRDY